MSRQWRIEYEGALYHVLSRGNERKEIFNGNEDRKVFLEALGQMSNRFDVEVHAYVLMGNHYHLLLRTKRANLSKAMQWFGVTYTRRFNLRNGRVGHLFQGRFKSILVENEGYLLRLSCYIHRNPLRAGMVHRLVDYVWSSYPAYAYGKNYPNWLETDLILSQFPGKERHRAYRSEIQRYSREEKKVIEDFRHGLLLGSRDFIEQIKTTYLKGRPESELPQQKGVLKDRDPGEFVERAGEVLKCDVEDFRRSFKIGKEEKDKRDLLLYILWELGIYSGREIGEVLGLGYSSVSRRAHIVRERIQKDKVFKKTFKDIKSKIKI